MSLLFIGIFLLITVISIIVVAKTDDEDLDIFVIIVGIFAGIFLIGSIIWSCCLSYDITRSRIIDDEIAMYTEEQQKAEQKIEQAVQEYMKHEKNTYIDLKPGTAIAIATTYPELSSNELIKTQVAIYNENSNNVIYLKHQKLQIERYRWLLYFG